MLPDMEELKGMSGEEVIEKVRRCLKDYRNYGLELSEDILINMYLKDLGFQELKTLDHSYTTNSLFIEEHIQRQAMRFIRGENWKKLAQLESKPKNMQDSDQKGTPQKESRSPQELNKPDNSDTTNSQFLEKMVHRQFANFIHGKSWKELVKLASEQTNQQESKKKKDQ